MNKAYRKIIRYEFDVDGEDFLLAPSGQRGCVLIEDAAKNGQEDTHFYGSLILVGGVWKLDEDSVTDLKYYFDSRLIDNIENYIAENGIPHELITKSEFEDNRTAQVPTFEEAWAEKEREGYQYGEDTLEHVRLGWEMSSAVENVRRSST